MTEQSAQPQRNGKRSAALSGVTAGATALSSVGADGQSLHYRGFDILDLAPDCSYGEVAYLLIHGQLPNLAELKNYKSKLRARRNLPKAVRKALTTLPAAAHPRDVLRTDVAVLGCALPEHHTQPRAAGRATAVPPVASPG